MQSIPPINLQFSNYIDNPEKIINLNQEIKIIAHRYNLQYLDLYKVLVASNGQLAQEYTTDGLHLTSKVMSSGKVCLAGILRSRWVARQKRKPSSGLPPKWLGLEGFLFIFN